jgi:phosphoglycolate phosphatase-like HAD superfamily hydrolase
VESDKVTPDCLVFDVDGVLIESGDSYQGVMRAVVEDVSRASGFEIDMPGYSKELNSVFKNNDSFNDDYDIIWALANIVVSRKGKKLSEAMPSPEALGKMLSTCSGDCGEWLPRHFAIKYGRLEIRALGQDAYCGVKNPPGMWTRDVPALEARWESMPYPVYIYTGRDLKEWRLAEIVLKWEGFPLDRVVHADTGIRKPSPKGLEYICGRFGHERPLFLGDTMGDRMAASGFGKGWFAAIGDLMPDAPLSFPDVKTALSSLIGWRP